jgi:hypothetical protein
MGGVLPARVVTVAKLSLTIAGSLGGNTMKTPSIDF